MSHYVISIDLGTTHCALSYYDLTAETARNWQESLLPLPQLIAAGTTEGLVKTVFDAKTGALLGAHMIGPEVTEMIQGFTLAITMEATEAELFNTVYPHPTMSEAMHEASLDAYGRVLHI